MRKHFKRLIPFGILLILILIVYLGNFHHYLSMSSLRTEHMHLQAYVNAHPFLSPLIFVCIYTLSVFLIIPDSTILTILSGLIFPLPLAIIYSVISEVAGALIIFSICNSIFRVSFLKWDHRWIHKLRKEFDYHAASYLLFLRVSHVLPFWLTNVIASYFHVRYWKFIWTAFVGVFPLAYILANAGHSLAKMFAQNKTLAYHDIFTIQIKIALFALGIIALFPILYKKFWLKQK